MSNSGSSSEDHLRWIAGMYPSVYESIVSAENETPPTLARIRTALKREILSTIPATRLEALTLLWSLIDGAGVKNFVVDDLDEIICTLGESLSDSDDHRFRRVAVRALGSLINAGWKQKHDIVGILVESGITNADADTVCCSVEFLSEAGRDAFSLAVPGLCELLAHSEWQVQQHICNALRDHPEESTSARTALMQVATMDYGEVVRLSAIEAQLAILGLQTTAKDLVQATEDLPALIRLLVRGEDLFRPLRTAIETAQSSRSASDNGPSDALSQAQPSLPALIPQDSDVVGDVTLQQMADLVQKSIKTLHHKKRDNKLPHPPRGPWQYPVARLWLLRFWPGQSHRLPEAYADAMALLRYRTV